VPIWRPRNPERQQTVGGSVQQPGKQTATVVAHLEQGGCTQRMVLIGGGAQHTSPALAVSAVETMVPSAIAETAMQVRIKVMS
jgi:hypothetical protein